MEKTISLMVLIEIARDLSGPNLKYFGDSTDNSSWYESDLNHFRNFVYIFKIYFFANKVSIYPKQ